MRGERAGGFLMRLRRAAIVAVTSQSSTSALQSQTNKLQEASCHDRWEEPNTDTDDRVAPTVSLAECFGSVELCEGATMGIAGSTSERQLMRLQDQVPVWC